MKPVIITSGEPAGIGPDILLKAASRGLNAVVIGDRDVFAKRARLLNLTVEFSDYEDQVKVKPGSMSFIQHDCKVPVIPGQLNCENAAYVVSMLEWAGQQCLQQQFSALVTAPVNKAIINQAGMDFSGHTEFLADLCGVKTVVMMLACSAMKVALVTTHLPLKTVPDAITVDKIATVVTILNAELQTKFGIEKPLIHVAGLNPHAGEGGYLGQEEMTVIEPCIRRLQQQGINVEGPFAADSMFTPTACKQVDAFVAMYHDQGLSVLKFAGFGQAVNITLGLPIIRTSVDHGSALSLAGSNQASEKSLLLAVETANTMARRVK